MRQALLAKVNGDEFTTRMFDALNAMMLDMLAAVARKDYEDRRHRQAQGQAKAKAEGRYKSYPELDFGHSGWVAERGGQPLENRGLGFRDVSGVP